MTTDDLAKIISIEILEVLTSHGAMMHNEMYDIIHDMDTGKVEKEITPIAKATVNKLYQLIKNNFDIHNVTISQIPN